MFPRQLHAVFKRSEALLAPSLLIRQTSVGIWVPTPIEVVDEACAQLKTDGWFTGARPGCVLDAGAGDGRVTALLSRLDPTRSVYGIEQDPTLYAQAVDNLDRLRRKGLVDTKRVHLIEGNYCDLLTYQRARINLRDVHLVFNYPDGNQRRLARFIAAQAGAQTKLCVLSHDHTIELDDLVLNHRRDVHTGNEPPWRLSIYGMPEST
jgi:tRNA G46 methylase TrmB